MRSGKRFVFRRALIGALGLLGACSAGQATASSLEVFHADSLAGPMKEIRKAFEARHQGVTIHLTSGVSKQPAERILKGDACDVFAPSSPAVIEDDLLNKRIASRNATALEGRPEMAQKIIDGAAVDPSKPTSVPDVIRAVKEGKANAGVTYYSAAVAAGNDLDIIRFPASVNQSDKIRNAALVPGGSTNQKVAVKFVRFVLSDEGQSILKENGQPPVVPAIRKGDVPAELR